MTTFYSRSTGGFYNTAINGALTLLDESGEEVPNPNCKIPDDRVEIEDDYRVTLLQAQSAGLRIIPDENGFPTAAQLPPPTDDEIKRAYSNAVQAHMNGAARARGYDSIASAISYAEEPAVAKFQNEGKAFRAWRSLCWEYCYEQLDLVLAGEREQPTIEAFIAELPALTLPA